MTLSAAETDSIIAALDTSEIRIRLLRVELDRCREKSYLDSTYLAIEVQSQRHPWWETVIRHPIVWFAFGAYLGLRAAGK